MSPLVAVALIGLASFRLWRFVARDEFPPMLALRDWISNHSPGWVNTLLVCGWCLGSWVTGLTTWAVSAHVSVQAPVLVGLASAALVGLVAQYDVAD